MGATEDSSDAGRSARGGRNVWIAILTGLVLAGAVLGSLAWDPVALLALAVIVLVLGQLELEQVLRRRGFHPATPVTVATGILLIVGAYWRGLEAMSFAVAGGTAACFGWFLAARTRRGVAGNLGVSVLSILYVPFFGAFVALVLAGPDGEGAVLGFALVGVINDVAAYAVGSRFGHRRMAPNVSPNKSWEGFAGACMASVLAGALILPRWHPWTWASGLSLGVLGAMLSPVGDLAESLIKRDLEVKDMGHLLPGHGGVLDRIDGLLLLAPAAYLLLRLFG
ncbi:MAG: phosphatidate cytidylyltransferase [Actinomycetota bacterium]